MDLFEAGQRIQLLQSVLDLTERGRLSWAIPISWSSRSIETMEATTDRHKFVVGSIDGDGQPPYFLDIFPRNEFDPDRIARIEAEPQSYGEDPDDWDNDRENDYLIASLLYRLYWRTKRIATNFDQTVSSIFDDLRKLDEFGQPPF